MTAAAFGRVSLDRARLRLAQAEEALGCWYDRKRCPVSYVSEGYLTVRLIEDVLSELVRARADLVVEVDADAQERKAALDRVMSAWWSGRR